MKIFAHLIWIGFGILFFLPCARAQHMNSSEAPCRNVTATIDVANCFGKAAKDVDRKLNHTYQQLLAVLQPDDQQKLRVAQRLWLQFRDTTCKSERDLYEGGTGANPAYLACMEEETRLRINDLNVTYGWVLEKFAK